jgi:general secretion pathway protein B
MSFILDALKKLEQKRNQESIPDLLTVHSSPVQKPQKRLIWLYIIVIALFINAGILLAWLKPWQSEKQVVTAQSSSEQPELASSELVQNPDATEPVPPSTVIEKTTEASVIAPDKIKSPSESAPVTANLTTDSLPSNEKVDSTRTLPADVKPDTKALSGESEHSGTRSFLPDEEELAALRGKIKKEIDFSAEAPSDESAISVHSVPGTAVSNEKVIEMSQLPSDIRSELPKISINTHIYSNNPSSRVVNINGIILREGEDIAKGLTLEEITSSGVILIYKDHLFRIRAF